VNHKRPPASFQNQNAGLGTNSRPLQVSGLYPIPHSSLRELSQSFLGAAPAPAVAAPAPAQSVLLRAGLKTATLVDSKIGSLIQSVLEQSRVLAPFIPAKSRPISIARNFVFHGSDEEFNSRYLKLTKTVVPFGSKEEKDLQNIRGFYDRPTDSIHLRPSSTVGLALRLAIHRYASTSFRNFFGKAMDEGLSLYFTNLVLLEQGLPQTTPEQYKEQLSCATQLVGLAGLNLVGKAYFENHVDLVRYLTTNLSLGPFRSEEIAGDLLCTTPLVSTARFASQQVKNMVAVGLTGPRSVRLWLRGEVPGTYELQISADSHGPRRVNITIPAGQDGDQTTAVTFPPTTNDPPLDPGRIYSYRVLRLKDNAQIGQGSFQTSPARDEDTPQKVVIATMSCHQPFNSEGTLAPESAKMLRLLPGILKDNNVRFVLLTGDQIYADYPGRFSIFTNPYLVRSVVPGKTSMFGLTDQEVRRVYDMRYRICWSMPSIQQMFANYPCYPAIDDHEIMDDWGSLPAHAEGRFANIWLGARKAYFDYQLSSILPPTPQLRRSFHYGFNFGNIGVFVMDLRSERSAIAPSRLMTVAQLDDLRQFLRNNGDKKVLLIVSSVPVVNLPNWMTDLGNKITGPDVDFIDQWSFGKNIPGRNQFLSLLHEHQQAHPNQRVAIVSGDIHIANSFAVHWQQKNKPRLYQFTSSAITNLFQGWKADASRVGPQFLNDIRCEATGFGGACSARVELLPAVSEAASRNPFAGLNLGLIEIQRFGDVSNLKFKLIGYHPTEERPVTYFESGWLG
jgi:hypothetical protein